ncbi:MAG TPA: hypothetical protein ENH07_10265 [Nitrospirae bacterium]|nr:hypothetical protein [Nitrospirota bacterium]
MIPQARDGKQGCKVLGCDRKHKGHGYCSEHLTQMKRNGKITRPIIGVYQRKPCLVENCGGPAKARGYCSRHIAQFYAHGKIIKVEKTQKVGCSVPGCDRPRRANGYCEPHSQQVRKHGKITGEKIRNRNGISTNGAYVVLLMKNHPMANKRGCVKRAHLVWEENTGHIVVPPEVTHHKNGNKKEDQFDNLELFNTDSEHQRLRHRKKGVFGVIKGGIIR